MKVVILAGGLGTRLAEETNLIPKPMINIGGKPILWHIMKTYSHYGYNEFVICLGYKGYVVKEYFANYLLHQSDVTIDMVNNRMSLHHPSQEPWTVTLVDTGLNTMTGGRLARVREHLNDEPFFLTYGDGVADIDVAALLNFHNNSQSMATLSAVQPHGRFGAVDIGENKKVTAFIEKPRGDGGWINGGYFVMQPEVFDYLDGDDCVLEQAPLQNLAKLQQLGAYQHHGFWRPMDTLRDKQELERYWNAGQADWKVW